MKAKHSPTFPLSARAVFRASAPALQQIPRNAKLRDVAYFPARVSPTGRLKASQPEIQSLPPAGKKLLASTSGTISALKSIRETVASWYVVYYGEGDKEVRISKNDPRRRVFDTLEAAEAWATGGEA